jgi:hypothetical protein
MSQPTLQIPALQTSPVPQVVPFVTLLHAVVLATGWQLSHALAGFGVAGA